jgi:hypothetical protein
MDNSDQNPVHLVSQLQIRVEELEKVVGNLVNFTGYNKNHQNTSNSEDIFVNNNNGKF